MKRTIILSIILCYYLRLPEKNQRELFREKNVNKKYQWKGNRFAISPLLGDILEIANQEMNELADRVTLPLGIAKNQALLENLFTLFVCINNHIPVFICGKPGCSKSLSVQLIYKSMKGESSDDLLFRKIPN